MEMIQDFVKIRKGTHSQTAFVKVMTILWKYLLFNSKNFKIEKTITINFSGGYTVR